MGFFTRKESLDSALTRLLVNTSTLEDCLYRAAVKEWEAYRDIDAAKGRRLFCRYNDARCAADKIGNKIREMMVLTACSPTRQEVKRAKAVVNYLDNHPVFQKLLERYLQE